MKGLLVSVYRDASGVDCTNGGATSVFAQFVLCGPGIAEIFEPSEGAPALVLVRRTVAGGADYLHAEPAGLRDSGGRPMFGGNFVSSSDSRFRAACGVALPVHDRTEKP